MRALFIASMVFFAFLLVNGLLISPYRVSPPHGPGLSSALHLVSPLVYGPRTAFSDDKLPAS
jgi:hypothetical protein